MAEPTPAHPKPLVELVKARRVRRAARAVLRLWDKLSRPDCDVYASSVVIALGDAMEQLREAETGAG